MTVEFALGCFDDFEGTQEELDSLVQHINELAASGQLVSDSTTVDAIEIAPEDMEAFLAMLTTQAKNSRQ